MQKIILIVFLFLFNNCFSQNLVPNGSFEQYSSCPWTSAQIDLAYPWFSPQSLGGSTDYDNACASFASGDSVPINFGGYQNVRTGVAYAAFGPLEFNNTNNKPTPPPGYGREYLEVQLTSPLVGEKKYVVSFYVSSGDNNWYAVDAIGAYFSINSITTSDPGLMALTQYIPQVENSNGIITDSINWVLISGSFLAQGGEQYLTIGNFKADSATKIKVINASSYNYFAYYYIDDVSVVEDTTTAGINEAGALNKEFETYPNSFYNKLTLQPFYASAEPIVINVFNDVGEVVYTKQSALQLQEIDLSALSGGVYLLQVQMKEKVFMKRIVKM